MILLESYQASKLSQVNDSKKDGILSYFVN